MDEKVIPVCPDTTAFSTRTVKPDPSYNPVLDDRETRVHDSAKFSR